MGELVNVVKVRDAHALGPAGCCRACGRSWPCPVLLQARAWMLQHMLARFRAAGVPW